MSQKEWIFILGGSSGFGLASAKYLAKRGYHIFIVHRDSRSKMVLINKDFQEISCNNISLITINNNANTKVGREEIIKKMDEVFTLHDTVKLFLFSIADGNISFLENRNPDEIENMFQHTINSMAISFAWWSKTLFDKGLFANFSRIIGITSEWSYKYLESYAFNGAAKSALENISRTLAIEFSKYNITTNLINAGITDTSAIKEFPNYSEIIEYTKNRNPFTRLTTPEDVAKVVSLLLQEEADWINGTIIRVDGGEQIMR